MNAQPHIDQALRELDNAAHATDGGDTDGRTFHLGSAQVHATLALAVATVESTYVAQALAESARA